MATSGAKKGGLFAGLFSCFSNNGAESYSNNENGNAGGQKGMFA